jgi:16S rRNA (guanine527-N7)-methyltransferase
MQFSDPLFQQVIKESQSEYGLRINTLQVDQLKSFIIDFIKWNKVHNLSAVNDFETLLRAHLQDSMAVVMPVNMYLNKLNTGTINLADLGSGGGFPSVVLAVLLPSVKIFAIESIKKKTAFLQNIKSKLNLDNYIVVDQRIEVYAEKFPYFFDATISRAFTELNNFLMYSKTLIKSSGIVFAMKSQRVGDELAVVDNQWKLIENIEIKIPHLDVYRCLLVLNNTKK